MTERLAYSVVVPVYNAAGTLEELVTEIHKALTPFGKPFEIILTNDCSPDNSWEIMERLRESIPELQIFQTGCNAGQMGATIGGIHQARGEFIITIDDDLQYPPKEISRLVQAIEGSNYDIVFGSPAQRMHNMSHNIIARLIMVLFDYVLLPRYRKINFYTTFRIFKRSLFFDEEDYPNYGRNLFYFWEIKPSKMHSISVDHKFRKVGKSNQTVRTLIKHYRPQIFWCTRIFSRISYSAGTLLSAISALLVLMFHMDHFTPLIYVFLLISVLAYLFYIWSNKMLEKYRRIEYEIKR